MARWRAKVQHEQAASSASGQPSYGIKLPALPMAISAGQGPLADAVPEDPQFPEASGDDTGSRDDAVETAMRRRQAAQHTERQESAQANKRKRQEADQQRKAKEGAAQTRVPTIGRSRGPTSRRGS